MPKVMTTSLPTTDAAAVATGAPVAALAAVPTVLDRINARAAWALSRGDGVTIAIVDGGIAGGMPEFPAARRSAHSFSLIEDEDPWSDPMGPAGSHGSMCASAAAGDAAARCPGVAPGATILSAQCDSTLPSLMAAYTRLIEIFDHGVRPLVVCTSMGLNSCTAPAGLRRTDPIVGVVRDAVARGIVMIFAAGNVHAGLMCHFDPAACGPNTIWGINSLDDVIAFGTVDADGRNDRGVHANSSRGPGQWATRPKPDLVAPTFGEIVVGNGYDTLEWWGTSGAAALGAGLAALLCSLRPSLSPAQVGEIMRITATPLAAPVTCVGAGQIDCLRAVRSLT